MNPVRPQNTPESPTLLNDLKAEVSAESAPLLQFIVRNSGLIVGVATSVCRSNLELVSESWLRRLIELGVRSSEERLEIALD